VEVFGEEVGDAVLCIGEGITCNGAEPDKKLIARGRKMDSDGLSNSQRETKERPPDRASAPNANLESLLHPGASGALLVGLFIGTLLILAAAAFVVGHQ
jgi:hypothetical protein